MLAFGRYQLVRLVGRGGMAEIWKARIEGPQGFEKTLALKRVLPELGDERNFVAMLVEEATLVATLVHPNIVQVFDFGESDGRWFFAMEYVAGTNVAALLSRLSKRGVELPREVALTIAAASARALAYAHARTDGDGKPLSVVHRDISPQNILVSFDGDVKVGDFGIARAATAIARTEHGHVRGKLAFMSPEQALMKPLDGRSDLFALGLVLYEMLTGRRILGGASEEIYRRVTTFAGPTEEELAKLSRAERVVLEGALAFDPADRFRDASAMEDAIAAALQPSGGEKPARAKLAELVREHFSAELELERQEATGSRETSVTPAPGTPVSGARTAVTPSDSRPIPPLGAIGVQPPAPLILSRRTFALTAGGIAVAGLAAGAAWGWAHPRGGIRRGGTLRIAQALPDEPFDPFTTADTRSRFVLSLILEPVIASDPDAAHPSGVVGKRSISADGKRVELVIRPGVTFHDNPCFAGGKGRRLEAEDLAFSIALSIREHVLSLPITGAKELLANRNAPRPSGLKVLSADTLAIEFDTPSSFFDLELADVAVFPREMEKTEPDVRKLRHPVGTGPFRFAEAPKFDRFELDRNPRWWQIGEDGSPLPYVDRVVMQSGSDYRTLISSVARGELDAAQLRLTEQSKFIVMDGARPRLADEFKNLPLVLGAAISDGANRVYGIFVVHGRNGPLADRRVRRAAAMAVDRASIARKAGYAGPALRFLRPDQFGFDPSITELKSDPAAARALLAETLHLKGKPGPELVVAAFGHPPEDELVLSSLREAGFRVRLMPITGASFESVVREKACDAVLSIYSYGSSGGEIPNLAVMYRRWGDSEATLDGFAKQLDATPVRADRIRIYAKLERALLDELPMIPVMWGKRGELVSAEVMSPRVQGLIDPATGMLIGGLPRAWLARSGSSPAPTSR